MIKEECPDCNGKGEVDLTVGFKKNIVECEKCNGTGVVKNFAVQTTSSNQPKGKANFSDFVSNSEWSVEDYSKYFIFQVDFENAKGIFPEDSLRFDDGGITVFETTKTGGIIGSKEVKFPELNHGEIINYNQKDYMLVFFENVQGRGKFSTIKSTIYNSAIDPKLFQRRMNTMRACQDWLSFLPDLSE